MSSDLDLSRLFREEDDELGVARLERRVRSTLTQLPERRRRRRQRVIISSALAGMLACGALWLALRGEAAPQIAHHGDGPLLEESDPPRPFVTIETDGLREVDLSDGSRLVLAPQTTLEIDENASDRVALRLARGRALFSIEPGGPRRWVIDAGPIDVEVIGTLFEIVREPTFVTVSVEHGVVRVFGEGLEHERRLTGGDVLRVPIAPPRARAPRIEAPAIEEVVEEVVEPPLRAEPSWQVLASRGDSGGAHRLLGEGRLVRIARTTQSAEELFLLADVAREAGSPEEALVPLRRILAEHPSDPRTPLAAFTLGRILADALHRDAEAGAVFARAAELGLAGDLSAVARERAFDAYRAANDARANGAAHEYLAHHPSGRAAQRIRAWLAISETATP